jgi:3',5'-cyclic AMP phosphodiesterase CpdA
VTLLHHPPYTKGSHNSDNKWDSGGRLIEVRENILPLLESAGVDLVLSGHSHLYERSDLINCHYGLSTSFKTDYVRLKSNSSEYKKQNAGLTAYNGTIYTVLGSSSKVDNGPLDHPAMPHALKEAGSLVIDINQARLNAYFINQDGKIKDHFEITKGARLGVVSKTCN